MRLLYLMFFLASCGPLEYSPWQSNPPARDLTAKHLGWLEDSNKDHFEPFKFVLSGDSQAVIEHFNNVIQVVNSRPDVDFTVVAGDLTDLGFRKEFEWFYRVMKGSNKPILTVVGNHDGLSNGPKIYREMFGPLNYSFIYKDIKFVMWNNNAYEWSVDLDFLENEVDSHARVIVVSHQPPYSEALSSQEEERWKAIRSKPNLIASLHAHNHSEGFYQENELPVYTVDRVTNTHFAVVEVREIDVKIYSCSPLCTVVSPKEKR